MLSSSVLSLPSVSCTKAAVALRLHQPCSEKIVCTKKLRVQDFPVAPNATFGAGGMNNVRALSPVGFIKGPS